VPDSDPVLVCLSLDLKFDGHNSEWNRGTSQINVEFIGIAATHTTTALCNFVLRPICDLARLTKPWTHDLVISTRVRFMAAIVQPDLYQHVPHA
jgi:hypothetical protein